MSDHYPSFEHRRDDELPDGWVYEALGNLGAWGTGGTPSKSRSAYWTNGTVPWVSPKDMKTSYISGAQDLISELAAAEAAKLVPTGTILFVVRGMILAHTFPVGLTTREVAFNQDMRSIVPHAGVYGPYLLRVLQHEAMTILFATKESTHGTLRLDSDTLLPWPIPLPPLPEQRRIVEKVEALLAEVKASRVRLAKVPVILKRFRQAVLAAACSGRLTEDWRASEDGASTAADWVAEIAKARRAALKKAGKGKEANLSEPVADVADGYPQTWCSTRIGDVAESLDHLRRPINRDERATRTGDIPYYGANGQVGWIDTHLFDEDLVLVVEDETFIGRDKPFSYAIRGKSWVNNHAHVLRALGGMAAEYLNICLSYYDFVPLTSGTTGRRKLTKSVLMVAPMPVAPLREQAEIVRRVEALFTVADAIEARVKAATATAERIPQAILSKAFKGELVPTEAELAMAEGRKYETAAEMLARVKAAEPPAKAAKKPRGRAAAKGKGKRA